MRGVGRGTLRQFWEETYPPVGMVAGTRDCTLSALGTLRATVAKTLAANAGAESINLFQITGLVEILNLYGVVTTVTSAGLTGAYFELYDSAASIVLTKNDGVISSLPAGSSVIKSAVAASTMTILDSTNGYFNEPTTGVREFQDFVLGQKTAANTYIRFTYTAAGAASGAIQFFCRYQCKSVGATLVAV